MIHFNHATQSETHSVPSMGRGMADRSQISACRSSPAVQMWHDECGAHAMPLTDDEWPAISATGTDGDLRGADSARRRDETENECKIHHERCLYKQFGLKSE
jgi:hypothetical protein